MLSAEERRIKEESGSDDDKKLVIKEEYVRDDPNVSATSSCDYSLSQFSKNEPKFEADDDGDESQDENALQIKQEDDSEEDTPLVGAFLSFAFCFVSISEDSLRSCLCLCRQASEVEW